MPRGIQGSKKTPRGLQARGVPCVRSLCAVPGKPRNRTASYLKTKTKNYKLIQQRPYSSASFRKEGMARVICSAETQ